MFYFTLLFPIVSCHLPYIIVFVLFFAKVLCLLCPIFPLHASPPVHHLSHSRNSVRVTFRLSRYGGNRWLFK